MTEKQIKLVAMLASASRDNRQEIIANVLEKFIREILDIPADQSLAHNSSFYDIGLDSITAVALKNKINLSSEGSIDFASSDIFDSENIIQLSELVAKKFEAEGIGSSGIEPQTSKEAKEISMDEVMRRMQDKLDDGGGSSDE